MIRIIKFSVTVIVLLFISTRIYGQDNIDLENTISNFTKEEFPGEMYNPKIMADFIECIKEISIRYGIPEFGKKLSRITFLPANYELEGIMKENNMKPSLSTQSLIDITKGFNELDLELSITRMAILFSCWTFFVDQSY